MVPLQRLASSPCVQLLMFATTAAGLKLNVTALGANCGVSTLECWQLAAPFETSAQPGIVGTLTASLGNVANASILVVPPSFDGGLHNAPRNQWVVILSGLMHLTLPGNASQSAYLPGGEFGLLFASDTAKVSSAGHRTVYPGLTETTIITIPTEDNEIPPHVILYKGPCALRELEGLRAAV